MLGSPLARERGTDKIVAMICGYGVRGILAG